MHRGTIATLALFGDRAYRLSCSSGQAINAGAAISAPPVLITAQAEKMGRADYVAHMANNDIVMLEGGPLIDVAALEDALGWTLQPKGLCKDDTCVIVHDRAALMSGDRVDVTVVASLIDRPAAHDAASGLVAIGAPRDLRRAAVNDMRAPEFTLPDLDGLPMNFSDHRSKKRLLVAFSSW